MMFLSIGAAAAFLGVSISTLRRWEQSGQLSSAHRTLGGHRRYDVDSLRKMRSEPPVEDGLTVCYARVSCHDQKDDLDRQAERLAVHCAERGFTSVEVIKDLGSGLNCTKRGLRRLLDLIARRRLRRLVIEHKDRLLRFGSELIFRLCANLGIEVIIVEPPSEKVEDRLVADVLELMTVFSAKLFGSRSHKRKSASAS